MASTATFSLDNEPDPGLPTIASLLLAKMAADASRRGLSKEQFVADLQRAGEISWSFLEESAP